MPLKAANRVLDERHIFMFVTRRVGVGAIAPAPAVAVAGEQVAVKRNEGIQTAARV